MNAPRCNLCGGKRFKPMGKRKNERCVHCSSLARTRVMAMLLEHLGRPRQGDRVLHLAPDPGLTRWLVTRAGESGYSARDLVPEAYTHCEVERFDLCSQAATLPDDHFQLIVHSHVMEHIPCNWTAVLWHLHRALHPDGLHVFCIPFLPGAYDERWRGTSAEERTIRFGQDDHVRRFGTEDLRETLGMVYSLPASYDLEETFSAGQLEENNIAPHAWKGFTPNTVLAMRKGDWLLG